MKKNFVFILALLIIAGGIFGVGCEKEVLNVEENAEETNMQKNAELQSFDINSVEVKNGMLVFKTRKDAQNYMKVCLAENNKLQQTEKQLGFKSVQTLYWEILDSQTKLHDEYEKTITTKEEAYAKYKAGEIKKYTDLTKKYLANGFIKEEIIEAEGEKMEHLKLTTSFPYYATILNLENMVMINDTIYQFNPGEMKMITDGDFSKIKQMQNATNTNLKEGIIVATNKTKDYHDSWQTSYKVDYSIGAWHCIMSRLKFEIWEYQTSQGLWRHFSYSKDILTFKRIWWSSSYRSVHYAVDYDGDYIYFFTFHNWSSSKSFSESGHRDRTPAYIMIREKWCRASDFQKHAYAGTWNSYITDYSDDSVDVSHDLWFGQYLPHINH